MMIIIIKSSAVVVGGTGLRPRPLPHLEKQDRETPTKQTGYELRDRIAV